MGKRLSKPTKKELVDSQMIEVNNVHDGHPIPCKVWKANGPSKPRAAVLFIHGGMFSKGGYFSHVDVTESLVRDLGLVVVTASFRDGSCTTYATGQSLQDLQSIARHIKSCYPDLPFGLVGSSSGGYFALALANQLHLHDVAFCIPLCPVADPHARAVYLQHCVEGTTEMYDVRHTPEKAKHILETQLQFFETMEQMQIAAEAVKVNQHSVPTLLVLGAADKNVPQNVVQHIQRHWANRTVVIGQVGHEIQNCPETEPIKSYIPDIDRFLSIVIGDDGISPKRK